LAALAAAMALGLSAAPAAAATCIGACGVAGANGDVTAPPTSATYGWISTAGGVDGAGQLSVGGTNGSSFTTSAFTASAGDNLRYYFNFISSDGQSAPGSFIFEDYAFVQLLDAATDSPVAMLFNARTEPDVLTVPGSGLDPISPGVTLTPASTMIQIGTGGGGGPLWAQLGGDSGSCWGPGCGYTGWIRSDFQVANSGSYRLKFGVSNWGDTAYQTGLAYSGLAIGGHEIGDGVPEPASWALMILGFGGIGAMMRGRANRRRLTPTAAPRR
jgi:hypothetical protein